MAISGMFFSTSYYLDANFDVARSWTGKPLDHYINHGALEGRAPNSWFNFQEYRAANADLAQMNAAQLFAHYENHGYMEGRAPSALYADFDEAAYLALYKDLEPGGITKLTALNHFLVHGIGEGRIGTNDDGSIIKVVTEKTGDTFTLTTSPDNIAGTSNNDTVNAYLNTGAAANSSTLSAADVIDGGAGTDSMYLTVEGTAGGSLTNASISNVEKFFIRDVATVASAYNFSSVIGETEVWANTATNTGAAVDFQNLGAGTIVGIKGNNVLTNLSNVQFNMAAATGAVNIAIDGGVKNTVAPTITNTTAGAATEAKISSTGAANTVGLITLAAAGNTVKALTVDAATALTAALRPADFAATATLTVTGTGKASLGNGFDGATIDASGNSGGLTISTTNTVTKSLTGSSAADTVTLVGTLTSAGKVDLGKGDDKLLVGAGAAIASTNFIDGGEGTDAISASLINAANAAAIQNFELLDISAATPTTLDVELITGSTITGLTLTGDTGGAASLTKVGAGVGLTVAGTNTGLKTIGISGASSNAADSFAITFDGAKAAAAPVAPNVTAVGGGIRLDGVETVSIASAGADNTWNGILLTGSASNTLQTLMITGDKNLNLDFSAANIGKALTGAADATNGLKMIDGSAATGKLDIDITGAAALNTSSAGLTVKGGSGDDTITLQSGVVVAGTLSGKNTVDAGGGDDTIIVGANGGTLTGGAGKDTFTVGLAVATGVTEATSVLTTITDLTAGDMVAFANGATSFQKAKVALGAGVTNLDLALAAAIDAAGEIAWFQYGANTYVVADIDANAVFSAGDTVVKLTGLVDLSAGSFNAVTDILTIA